MWRGLIYGVIACTLMPFFATPTPVRAANIVSLTPNPPSGALVGTIVTWTVSATGVGTLQYRFSVGRQDGTEFLVLRDFSASNSFTWTPMQEGAYRVKATVIDETGLPGVAESIVSYSVASRITGQGAVVSQTQHPLVALYSIPPCIGRARVEFRPQSGTVFQTTHTKPCVPGLSVNFFVAGMRPSTNHVMRHVVMSGGSQQPGPLKPFLTGALPPALPIPEIEIPDQIGAGTSFVDDVLLQSVLVRPQPTTAFTLATDFVGNVIWYHDEAQFGEVRALYRPVPGGTMLMVGPNGPLEDQFLREIDLVGSTIRETNVPRVNQQLALRGLPDRIGSFHHEANRLPNGDTIVLSSLERVMNDVQGATGPVDILGDMILVLDLNLQVKWIWNAFDHLDVERKAVLGETCVHQGPGCPPLSMAIDGKANDWTHGNAVTYSPSDGNLLFSMRHQDWVVKINYANGTGDGSIMWRIGPGGDFTISSPDLFPWFSHQHDARHVGPGHISVYDNGNTRCAPTGTVIPGCNSRGQVFAINEANKTATRVINADLGHYSAALGSAERLSNGNYHFGSGFLGSPPATFARSVEVLPTGTIEYIQETTAGVYRFFRMRNLYMP
jgi:hypothetical protein